MRRVLYGVIGIAILGVIVAGGGYLVLVVTGGNGEASQVINAPALGSEPGAAIYRIVPEESEVRFIVGEILRGVPTTAIGVTSQVAGDIALDLASPANSEIGLVRINVRTLETDQNNRNRALRSFILKSGEDQFEFAEFQPTALEGLPDRVMIGEPFSFQIVGDLTVTGATNTVTFDTTATLEDEQRLTGQASTMVLYPDFNLTIPNVSFVAGVDEEVRLEIDFVAQAVAE